VLTSIDELTVENYLAEMLKYSPDKQSELISCVAFDMRALNNAVIGMTMMLQNEVNSTMDPAELKYFLEGTSNAAANIKIIIDALHEYVHLTAGSLDFE
jgi:hypothetical protein